MPNINLIAVRREEKKRLVRLTRQLFFGMAGAVGCFILAVLVMGTRQIQTRSELADANQKMQKLQPILDRIEEIEKDTNELLPKVETLQSAKANTLRWRAVLQVISQSVPDNTFLSAFNASGTPEDTSITLVGTTGSQSLVGDTMLRLKTHPMFDNVELKYTQAEVSTQVPAPPPQVRFEIMTHLATMKTSDDKDKAGSGDADTAKEPPQKAAQVPAAAVTPAPAVAVAKKEGTPNG